MEGLEKIFEIQREKNNKEKWEKDKLIQWRKKH